MQISPAASIRFLVISWANDARQSGPIGNRQSLRGPDPPGDLDVGGEEPGLCKTGPISQSTVFPLNNSHTCTCFFSQSHNPNILGSHVSFKCKHTLINDSQELALAC